LSASSPPVVCAYPNNINTCNGNANEDEIKVTAEEVNYNKDDDDNEDDEEEEDGDYNDYDNYEFEKEKVVINIVDEMGCDDIRFPLSRIGCMLVRFIVTLLERTMLPLVRITMLKRMTMKKRIMDFRYVLKPSKAHGERQRSFCIEGY